MWCPVLITATGLLLREQQAQAVLLCIFSSTAFIYCKNFAVKMLESYLDAIFAYSVLAKIAVLYL